MSILVVFYSRADENYINGEYTYIAEGNTEKAAKFIAKVVNADIFRIEQKIPYAPDYKTCVEQAKKDKESDARPELVSVPDNLDKYDEIFIGYPIYFGTMPMAMYTFLEACDLSGKTIHPFCTHEGSNLSSTVNEIRNIVKNAIVTSGYAIVGSKFLSERYNLIRWDPVYMADVRYTGELDYARKIVKSRKCSRSDMQYYLERLSEIRNQDFYKYYTNEEIEKQNRDFRNGCFCLIGLHLILLAGLFLTTIFSKPAFLLIPVICILLVITRIIIKKQKIRKSSYPKWKYSGNE